MFNKLKVLFLSFIFTLTPIQGFSEPEQVKFKYEYTEIIIHFTPAGQIYNGRSNGAYDSQHYFSLFYDLLIRYLGQMELFDPVFSLDDIDVWHEMHMVSQFGSQVLYVGDHILSDGQSWVLISDKDYIFLQELISETKKRDLEPVADGKAKLISDMVHTLEVTSSGDSYTEHFKKYELPNVSRSNEDLSPDSAEMVPPDSNADKFSYSSSAGVASNSSSSNKDLVKAKGEAVPDNHFSSRGSTDAEVEDMMVTLDEKMFWTDKKLLVVILALIVLIAFASYLIKKSK